jgi:hypothetical protein
MLFDYNLVTYLDENILPSASCPSFFRSNETRTALPSSNILSAWRADAIQIAETILRECFDCLLLEEVNHFVVSNFHVSSKTSEDASPSCFYWTSINFFKSNISRNFSKLNPKPSPTSVIQVFSSVALFQCGLGNLRPLHSPETSNLPQAVTSSNLGQVTDYPDWDFRSFPKSFKPNAAILF